MPDRTEVCNFNFTEKDGEPSYCNNIHTGHPYSQGGWVSPTSHSYSVLRERNVSKPWILLLAQYPLRKQVQHT